MTKKIEPWLILCVMVVIPCLCQANPSSHETGHTVISTGSIAQLNTGANIQTHKILPGVMMLLLEKLSPRLSVTPATRVVASASGTTTFDVSNTGDGTMAWSAAVTSGESWLSIASGSSGSNSGTISCDYTAYTGTSSRKGTIQITAASAIGSPMEVTVNQTACGAYVASGVWKAFDCYNLAAIGKTTNDDPSTPSWRLIGGYWQWGRKGPDHSQWYDTNTPNYAHGPTGSDAGSANSGTISGWGTTNAPDGSWSDTIETANDPCPAGFRVPTRTQWDGVIVNNTQRVVGTWSDSATNYSSARFLGDDLMLPAAGFRSATSGELTNRGDYGFYWSSTQGSITDAWSLYVYSSVAGVGYDNRTIGFSVRCVAE